VREVQPPAGVRERLLRISDGEDRFPLDNLSFFLEPAKQGGDLGKQRNRITRVSFGAVKRDSIRLEINMLATEISALGRADSRLAHELYQIGRIIVFQFHHDCLSSNFIAEMVSPQMLHNVEELLPRWGETNGLFTLELFELLYNPCFKHIMGV